MVTFEDRLEIAKILERGHSIFRQFWDIGAPELVDYRDTACITFDLEGNQIGFQWNSDFWDSLDVYNRAFVSAHEMLHILLNHGPRMLSHKDDRNSNIAMDLVVNHLLVDYFGFDRDKLNDWESKCWVDTIFEKSEEPARNKSYEYYYNLLKNKESEGKSSTMPNKQLVDEHGIIGQDSLESVSGELENYIMASDISNLKDVLDQHGNNEGSWVNVVRNKMPPKRKWQCLIPPNKNRKVYDFKMFDTWVRENRRMSDMLEEDDTIFLQTEAYMEDYYMEPSVRSVWFFLDYSISCQKYLQRFLDASQTLANNKFDVKLYTFDVKAYEVPPDFKNIRGGGGTCFQCIENTVLKEESYPDNIFVITDGEAAPVKLKHPERWHWFLTPKLKTRAIPKKCHTYLLEEFE